MNEPWTIERLKAEAVLARLARGPRVRICFHCVVLDRVSIGFYVFEEGRGYVPASGHYWLQGEAFVKELNRSNAARSETHDYTP